MKYFTSDWHIQHKKIVEFTDRGICTTQKNHDDWLLDTVNSSGITNNDQLWILGDFAFNQDVKYLSEFLNKIKGQKFIIKGNHDNSKTLNALVESKVLQGWYQYKKINVNIDNTDKDVCLFHFPIMSWEKQGRGSWHLHGHSHGNLQGSQGFMLDVGIDNAYNLYGEHKVFTEEMIKEYMQKQTQYTSDLHRKG